MAVQHDKCRTPLGLSKYLECPFDPLDVIRVADPQDIPSIGNESRLHVFRKCNARIALDGDVVVVVNPAEIVEAEMSSKRGGFRCNAFHEAAVTADGVDVVIEDFEARPVVMTGKPFLGDCHPHACSCALTKRAGRGLNS